MSGCCSVEGIGVYVRRSHWAHALLRQSAELGDAVRRDDDATLERLFGTGADINTINLDGHSLLGIARRLDKRRCRAMLEARGAKLDPKYGKEGEGATGDTGGVRELPHVVQGRGLEDPGDFAWAAARSLLNNFLAFHLHFKRGRNPATLTDDEAASPSEKSWMFAYAQIEYPRTLSLIVWRRSGTIVMSVTTLVHAMFQYWAAWAAQQHFETLKIDAQQSLHMMNRTDTWFWTSDPTFLQDLRTDQLEDNSDIELLGAPQVCHAFSSCPTDRDALEGLADGMGMFANCDATSSFFRNCTYFEAPRLESFSEYSVRMAHVGLARMIVDAEQKHVWVLVAVATCAVIAWICNIAAMNSWYNLKKSKKFIALGWLFTFIAPFIISIVPMRMFVDWDQFCLSRRRTFKHSRRFTG